MTEKEAAKKMHMENKEWERVEGESAKSFEAFRKYRDMGVSRSLSKVSEEMDKSLRLLKRWSAAHRWVARVDAYDAYMEKKALDVYENKLEDVNEAHLDMVRSARESVMVPLRALLQRIDKLKESGGLTADEIKDIPTEKLLGIARPYVKLTLDVIKMERLLYGLPTQTIKTEGRVSHELSHDIKVVNEFVESLPDEELLRIVRDSKRRKRRRDGGDKPVSD